MLCLISHLELYNLSKSNFTFILTFVDMMSLFYSDMMALGFEKPRSLSLNMIAVIEMFYKVASSSLKMFPRLSLKREIFYHFQMETKLDSFNVSRALQITFKKIMMKEDHDILFPFIFEHFPQVQISKTDIVEKSGAGHAKKDAENHPFVEQIVSILQRGDWPLLIGPIGIGKTSAIHAAAKFLKKIGQEYEVREVSLSSYSSNEIFGWDEKGKRYTGILSNYLDQTSKPMLIVLQAPLTENVAQVLASMYDNSVLQRGGNNSSASGIPPTPHRIVLETFDYEIVPSILLARCSIISISKEDETGLSELFPSQWKRTGKLNASVEAHLSRLKEATHDLPMITNDDAELRRMSRQTLVLFKLMVGTNSNDEIIVSNCIVSSFCWSFGVSIVFHISCPVFFIMTHYHLYIFIHLLE